MVKAEECMCCLITSTFSKSNTANTYTLYDHLLSQLDCKLVKCLQTTCALVVHACRMHEQVKQADLVI